MEIYEAVVMFLPCMSWEVMLSAGILKSFLSGWVCWEFLIYMYEQIVL